MQNILVTGGTGYIGSHIVLKLLIRNYKVIIYDSFKNSSPVVINRIKKILNKNNYKCDDNLRFIKGDLRDFELLNTLFRENSKKGKKIDAVLHLGGLKSIIQSKNIPLEYWDFNVSGTINLLKVMSINNCRNFIFSSSATVYGENNESPFKESFNLFPINPYANTKAVVEKILIDICQSKKIAGKFLIYDTLILLDHTKVA